MIRYAHIPGGGPTGKTCRDCHHRTFDGLRDQVCAEAARMAGKALLDVEPVSAATPACKYWRARCSTSTA